jgi:hypothetical protein
MTKFSELDAETRERHHNSIGRRWSQLHELEEQWAERSFKYLFLTNSGGAIATLSFLGASKEVLSLFPAKLALAFFVVGIFLMGVATAKTYHPMSSLYEKYKASVRELYADRITWDYLNDEDNKRAVTDYLDYAIPYGSFACFIFGCIAGAYALFA